MSTTVDERVVSMQFDNKHFESNVKTSLSTLDKLKQSLNFSGATKGLDNVNSAVKNVNLNPLSNGVETVRAKFSALDVMAVTALSNITNSAVNAGKNIVKSLTIDPIKSGFSEYETKMGSIQTILANTEHQGTTLDQVTAALDKLNLYADKTIYNFQEMTRNIGTFTAAGVDLDTSVRSIQGIANLAAVSGSTSQQASTAMYQLSQALSAGTVKLMDWNSVVNAGMGGKVFQNALIQTAAMLDGSADKVEEWQKKHIDAHGSFRESLSKEQWLTSEVLTKTLEQFTMAAEEGSKEWEEFKKSLMSDGYTEQQAESILKMANTATNAATKVKTFTQLMDTLKESAQSGWAQTWESIVGDFEEAKEFFTGLSDLFGGIIGDSADRRNTLVTETMSSNWDKLITKINEAGIETEVFEDRIRGLVGSDKLDELIAKYGSLPKVFKEGALSTDILKKALGEVGEVGKTALDFSDLAEKVKGNEFLYSMGGLGRVSDDVKRIQEALNSLGYDISADGKFGKATYHAVAAFQKAQGIKIDGIVGEETIAALQKATGKTAELTGDVNELSESYAGLIDGITKKSGRELLLGSLMNIIHAIHRPLEAVGEALRNTFSVSPTQLYNALEAINKFTDKFVMKGVLDITTWDKLTDKINDMGISTSDFTNKLKEVLKDHGTDVDDLFKKYKDWKGIFESGAISTDILKETLLSFDGISESMLLGGESADKVRRAFEGLFAIIEIIGTVAGSGIRIAFKVLTSVLDAFGTNVLDVAANLGDAISGFRDWIFEGNLIAKTIDSLIAKLPILVDILKEWFNVFKETPAVQKLVTAIDAIRESFNKLMSGDINLSEFASSLGTNLANAVKSLPEIAVQVASDFIAGFMNGIGSSVSNVISNIKEFCLEFVSAFATELGVQSPSWKAFEIAVDFFQGFINGAKKMLSKVAGVLKIIGSEVVKIFKSLWDFITDESGNIEWGKIISGGIIASVLWILKQFATAFNGIAEAFGGLGKLFIHLGKTVKSFNKVLNAYAWDLRAKALQKLAIAIAILVACVVVLAQVDDTSKLWNAVGVIAALAGVVVALSVAMSLLSKGAATFENGKLDIKGIQSSLLQIGIVIALLAVSVKMIADLKPEEAEQGFLGLAAMAGGLIVFMTVMAGISRFSGDLGRFGKTMLLMSVSMLLMTTVIKKIAGIDSDDIFTGLIVMEAFMLLIMQMGLANRLAGQGAKVGGAMIGMSIAMAIMVGVIKLVASVDQSDIRTGLFVMEGFVLLLMQMGLANRLAGQGAKVGRTILSMSIAMTLLVGVIKLIATIDPSDLQRGFLVMEAFVLLIAEMLLVSRLGKDVGKVAGTILAFSVSIGILAGLAILLSLIDTADLAKGIVAVGMLSAMMALMTRSLKGAQNAKGAIMMMAVCIGVMAAAVVALSFIPIEDLVPAVAGLGILMSAFALMIKSLTGLKNIKIGPIIALTGVVVVLAGIIYLMNGLDPLSAVGSATALSVLMLAMAGVLAICKVLKFSNKDFTGILGLVTIALSLVILVEVLRSMQGIENARENAITLALLAGALSLCMIPIAVAGKFAAGAIVGAVAIAGVMAALFIVVEVLRSMQGIEGARENAITLALLTAALSLCMLPLALAGMAAAGAIIGAVAVAGVMAALLIVVEVLNRMQGITNARENAITLALLAAALTLCMLPLALAGMAAAGALIGVVALAGLMASLFIVVEVLRKMDGLGNARENAEVLARLAIVLSLCMIPLGLIGVLGPAAIIGAASLAVLMASLFIVVGVLSKMEGLSNAQASADILIQLLTTMTSALVQISLLAPLAVVGVAAMSALIALVSRLGVMVTAVGALMDMCPSIEDFIDNGLELFKKLANGLGEMLSEFMIGATSGLEDVGTNLSKFMENAKYFIDNVGSIDQSVINGAGYLSGAIVALLIADFISAIASLGGMSLADLGTELSDFAENIGGFITAMGTIDSKAATGVTSLCDAISALTTANLKDAITQILPGDNSLENFGANIEAFASAIQNASVYLANITDDDVANIKRSATAGEALAELNKAIPAQGGIVQTLLGEQDLAAWGRSIDAFASCLISYSAKVSGQNIDVGAIKDSATAGTAISELNGKIPKSGGWAQDILGEQDLATWGKSIVEFARCLVNYSNIVSGGTFNTEAITASASAADALANLNGKIPKAGGWAQEIMGQQDLATFGTSLVTFGNGLKSYSTSVSGIDESKITAINNSGAALDALLVVMDKIPTTGGWKEKLFGSQNGQTFGDSLASMAKGIKDYCATAATISESDITAITNSGTAITTLGQVLSLVPETSECQKAVNLAKGVANLKSVVDQLNTISESGYNSVGMSYVRTAVNSLNALFASIDTETFVSDASMLRSASTSVAGAAKELNKISECSFVGVYDFKNAIADLAETDLDSVVSAFANASTSMATAINTLINAMSTALTAGATTIDNAMSSLVDVALKAVDSKKDSFTTSGESMVSNLATGLGDSSGSVSRAGNSLGGSAVNGVRSRYTTMYNAANYIVLGLIRGLNEGQSRVREAAENLADAVKDGITLTLIIKSPSRLAEQYGAYTGEGFVNGLNAYTGRAYDAGTDLGNGAATGLSDTISKISDAVSADMDMTPTIRPVVDLSNVNAGADAISSLFGGEYALGANPHLGAITALMNGGRRNSNDDVIAAIRDLNNSLSGMGNTYTINGITYDEGSGVAEAIRTITRAAKLERRV